MPGRLCCRLDVACSEAEAAEGTVAELERIVRRIRQRRVVGKAEWLPGQRGANPRFVVTSLSREEVAGRSAVRGTVLRPRRDGEPDQGATAGSVRGPHIDGDDAGEPAADVLFGVRRHAAADHAPLRAGGQSAGAGPKRHDPEQDPEGGRGGDGAQGMAAFLLDVPAQGTLREHREAADGSEAKGLPGMSVADGRTGAMWRAEGRGQAEVRPDCAPGGQQACQEGQAPRWTWVWQRVGIASDTLDGDKSPGLGSTCAQSATVAAQDGHRAQLW